MPERQRNEYLDRALTFTLAEIKKRKPSSESPRKPKSAYPKGVTFHGLDDLEAAHAPDRPTVEEKTVESRQIRRTKAPEGISPMESLRQRMTKEYLAEDRDPADSEFLRRYAVYQAKEAEKLKGNNNHVNGSANGRVATEFGVSRNPAVTEEDLRQMSLESEKEREPAIAK